MGKWNWLPLIVVAFFTANASATSSANIAGKQLFQEGKYQQAFDYFKRQEAAGRGSNVNTYNMAVCLYRLNRYAESRRLFLKLSSNYRWRPLANYNLGLIARMTGTPREAHHYFTLAANQRTNAKIRSLALRRLEAYPKEPEQSGKWIALIRARAGHDTDATRMAADLLATSSQGADNYLEVLGFAQTWITGNPHDGVKFYALALDRRFSTFHSVDTQVAGGDLSYEHQFYGVQTESGMKLLHTNIDGVTVSSQVEARFALSQDFSGNLLSIVWMPSHYFASSAFPQVDGSQQRIELSWRRDTPQATLKATYGYEVNNRADLTQGATFASYSPTRNVFKGEALWQFSHRIRADAFVTYQHSIYAGINSMVDTDGLVKTAQRRNNKTTAGAWVAYQITPPWTLRFSFTHVKSADNFNLYSYSSSRISASIAYIMF